MLNSAEPADDEFEVTLLGSGVGESCVVHLGNQRWMIVDSFNESSAGGGIPAAQRYLQSLNVLPEQVALIVLTHLHADHYRGLDDLVRHYTSARLVLPAAIEARRFSGLFSREGLKVLPEVVDAVTVARARFRNGVMLYQGVSVLSGLGGAAPASVTALAPSDAACAKADESLAEVLQKALADGDSQHNVAAAKKYLEDQNLTSIALHVSACGLTALLGGDVVNDTAYGWPAIVNHDDSDRFAKADVFKVPHHGSEGALFDAAMDKFLESPVLSLVTAFTSSEIPKDDQLQRLLLRGQVWQTSPSPTRVSRVIAGVKVDFPASGAVQARRRASDGNWTVEFREPAVQVQPSPAAAAPNPPAP